MVASFSYSDIKLTKVRIYLQVRHKQALCQSLNFSVNNDLEIAQLTFGQCHDTRLGYKQSLCEVRTSNLVDQIDMDWTRILHRQGQSD